MSGLYDTDILTWSERQAALLRWLAAGERVNDMPEVMNGQKPLPPRQECSVTLDELLED